jgi:multidrug efflux pump subunit AcrA (membrane-fusion protein)
MNAIWSILLLAALGQVSADAPYPTAPAAGGDPTFRPASITADNDIHVFAEAEGILVSLPVSEGSRVAEGQVLALIDDRQAQAAVKVAKAGHEAALERAKDDIEERYAIAAAKVAKIDWQKNLEANQNVQAVSPIEILQKKLVYDRSVLQTEKARKDQFLAGKEADVKKAELEAAHIALEHRSIRARFNGEVQQLFQKEGQWVNPGDPILQLVQFDKLRVECFVKSSEYDPVELANRRVTVRVRLARDREAAISGRVTYVSQTVQPVRGDYLVRAEVDNQRNGEYWLIRPGLEAEMTIHVSEPPVDAPVKETAQK